ncbi:MAG: homoserine dehydrogenase [Paracoccaceae bacterium]
MLKTVRIGIAGLGTVGIGVINIIRKNLQLIEAKTNTSVEIVAISAKSKSKSRGISLEKYQWESDPTNLAKRDDIDIFVELIGGENGPARQSVEAAILSGKHVVTANKALLAIHGEYLAKLSEKNNVSLKFEAAVAGGIPIVKVLNESLAGNKINKVTGVINGSCNYILTRMEQSDSSYEAIFAEATELGYLEADPKLDVGGIDSAHKLAILSSLAFGTVVNYPGVSIKGIENITLSDIKYTADMGFKIKLLGVSEMTPNGLRQTVSPCLVSTSSSLAQLEGGTNMVVLNTSEAGNIILQGLGAGREPTASSVIADIIDIIRLSKVETFGKPHRFLERAKISNLSNDAPYYLKLMLDDKPGALALITKTLGDNGISINRMRQYDHNYSRAPVSMITHTTSISALEKAIAEFPKTGVISLEPVILRVEDTE